MADRQAKGATGEKIGFEKMAKTIGKRWKELSSGELGRFKVLAKEDTERYRREMDAYNYELAMKSRREREEMSRRRMQEAGMQPQAPVPTSLVASTQAAEDKEMGQFAGTHLLSQISGASSAPLTNPVASSQQQQKQQAQNSFSAQLNQILGGSGLPTLQGLRGLLAGAPQQRSNPLQDALMHLGQPQQQNQTVLEGQLLQQNQARLENQLRQQQDQLRQEQQQTQAQLEDQLRQNLLNRALANPSLIGSLPPSLQQQLLVQSLQGGGSHNLLAAALNSLSSAPGPDTRA